jgi:hypothetical protein
MKIPVLDWLTKNETPTLGGLAFSRGEGTVRIEKSGTRSESVKKWETVAAPH